MLNITIFEDFLEDVFNADMIHNQHVMVRAESPVHFLMLLCFSHSVTAFKAVFMPFVLFFSDFVV